ncbi:hypothetical protein H310_02894 [Aphanomyces invadans]|uniref:EF-hand domain-containing protein n=1 Tax=Aphanomyces invadans TaxID=157072 RepID=A0A024ULI0_9STRA|nr:hypothetical protein H310_02894 [Aphanomyces invadans]ETW06717.1 hypothetical protein H310_02894 [Aphanomyces invadans]|eukprot:XP_008864792.1 hypothetical protein H310_02894 [Aphanomyces invadans]
MARDHVPATPVDDAVRAAKLTELFELLDHDHSGDVTWKVLDAHEMQLLGVAVTGATDLPSLDESRDQIRRADCDHNTRVDLAEWVAFGMSTSLYDLNLDDFIALMDTYAERVHRHYDDGGHLKIADASQASSRWTRSALPPLLSAKSKRMTLPPEPNARPPLPSPAPAPMSTWFWGRCAECSTPGRISCNDCHVLLCLDHGTSHAVMHLDAPVHTNNQDEVINTFGHSVSENGSTSGLRLKSASVQHPRVKRNRKAESCRIM